MQVGTRALALHEGKDLRAKELRADRFAARLVSARSVQRWLAAGIEQDAHTHDTVSPVDGPPSPLQRAANSALAREGELHRVGAPHPAQAARIVALEGIAMRQPGYDQRAGIEWFLDKSRMGALASLDPSDLRSIQRTNREYVRYMDESRASTASTVGLESTQAVTSPQPVLTPAPAARSMGGMAD